MVTSLFGTLLWQSLFSVLTLTCTLHKTQFLEKALQNIITFEILFHEEKSVVCLPAFWAFRIPIRSMYTSNRIDRHDHTTSQQGSNDANNTATPTFGCNTTTDRNTIVQK